MSVINAEGAQECGCMFTFCHAYMKMGVLLHKMAIVCNLTLLAVCNKWAKEHTKYIKSPICEGGQNQGIIVLGYTW